MQLESSPVRSKVLEEMAATVRRDFHQEAADRIKPCAPHSVEWWRSGSETAADLLACTFTKNFAAVTAAQVTEVIESTGLVQCSGDSHPGKTRAARIFGGGIAPWPESQGTLREPPLGHQST